MCSNTSGLTFVALLGSHKKDDCTLLFFSPFRPECHLGVLIFYALKLRRDVCCQATTFYTLSEKAQEGRCVPAFGIEINSG